MSARIAVLPLLVAISMMVIGTYLSVATMPRIADALNTSASPIKGGPFWYERAVVGSVGGIRPDLNAHFGEARIPVEEPQVRHSRPAPLGAKDSITIDRDPRVSVGGRFFSPTDTEELSEALTELRRSAMLGGTQVVVNADRDSPWSAAMSAIGTLEALGARHAFRVSSWPRGGRRMFHFYVGLPSSEEEWPTSPARIKLSASWASEDLGVEETSAVLVQIGERSYSLPTPLSDPRPGYFPTEPRNAELEGQNGVWQAILEGLGELPTGVVGADTCVVEVGAGVPCGVVITLLDLLIDTGRTEGITLPTSGWELDLLVPSTHEDPGATSADFAVAPISRWAVIISLALGALALLIAVRSSSSPQPRRSRVRPPRGVSQ